MCADELCREEMKDTRAGSLRWKPTRVACSHPLSINWLSEEGTWFMSAHFHVNVPTTADARLWCDITTCGVIGACHSAFSARQMTSILSISRAGSLTRKCPELIPNISLDTVCLHLSNFIFNEGWLKNWLARFLSNSVSSFQSTVSSWTPIKQVHCEAETNKLALCRLFSG